MAYCIAYDYSKVDWLDDYIRNGVRAGGLSKVTEVKDYSGDVQWNIAVRTKGKRFAGHKPWVTVKRKGTDPSTGRSNYGLFASVRFERGEVISMRQPSEESSLAVDLSGSKPTTNNLGLGVRWAKVVDSSPGKKAMKECNAMFAMDGNLVRAMIRILPDTEIVIASDTSSLRAMDVWKEIVLLNALVFEGNDAMVNGLSLCLGRVTNYNRRSATHCVRFDDGRVVNMKFSVVESHVLRYVKRSNETEDDDENKDGIDEEEESAKRLRLSDG